MDAAQDNSFLSNNFEARLGHVVEIGRPAEEPAERGTDAHPRNHGFFHFIAEMRRRRVCRAAAMYSIAMWLVCQVAEIVCPELGLPEWTLKFVITLGLLGFPIALILSWLIDVTPNGLVFEGASGASSASEEAGPRRTVDQVMDFGLVAAALVIGVHLTVGVLSTDVTAAEPRSQKIAVVPFRIASGSGADAFSQGLVTELQHELMRQAQVAVIAPVDPYRVADSFSLTGAVSVDEKYVRITAMMVDNDTGVINWSQVFQRPRKASLIGPAELAREIVAALPVEFRASSTAQVNPGA